MKTLDNVNTFLFIHLWACQFLLTIQEMFEMEQNVCLPSVVWRLSWSKSEEFLFIWVYHCHYIVGHPFNYSLWEHYSLPLPFSFFSLIFSYPQCRPYNCMALSFGTTATITWLVIWTGSSNINVQYCICLCLPIRSSSY